MGDAPSEVSTTEPADSTPQWADRLTRKDVAAFLGCSEAAVIRLEKKGRLVSLTGKHKKAWFSLEDVRYLQGQLRAERDPVLRAKRMTQLELAHDDMRAQHVGDLVSTANSHAEEFFKLAVSAVTKCTEVGQNIFADAQRFHAQEYKRLTERIVHLEAERAEFVETLEKLRRDELDAADKRENRALARETFVELKGITKAVIASKMNPGPAREGLQLGAVQTFMSTLSDDQWDGLLKILKPEQTAMVMMLAQSAEAMQGGPAKAAAPEAKEASAAA